MAAARVGYRIAAFDIFNDVDTRRFCVLSDALPFYNGSFDATALMARLDRLDISDVTGVAYGSGFEKQPQVLEAIATRFKLLGNPPEVLAGLKDPARFFSLLETLSIPHPETRSSRPAEDAGWLLKASGGSGGTHIRPSGVAQAGDYFQRQLTGVPISVLFLADGSSMQIIGYNEQWLAPGSNMPYRYGGAVSHVMLSPSIRQQMATWVAALVQATGMRGIQSMDCLLTENGAMVLEINPRLSATMGLYDLPDVFERHVQASDGRLSPLPGDLGTAKAQHIVYAVHDIRLPADFTWPDWVLDQPASAMTVRCGEPLCTVVAEGCDADSAKQLAFARAGQLHAQLHF